MVRKTLLTALLFVFVIPALAFAYAGKANLADVRIISDGGSEFPLYRTYPRLQQEGSFFFVEAVKGRPLLHSGHKQIGGTHRCGDCGRREKHHQRQEIRLEAKRANVYRRAV